MKINYEFQQLTPVEKFYIEHLLLEEMEVQNWFAAVRIELLRGEQLICVQ